ncbi:hypothetical protein EMIT0P74_10158 [Pseudomonas sp. IT-P74]
MMYRWREGGFQVYGYWSTLVALKFFSVSVGEEMQSGLLRGHHHRERHLDEILVLVDGF